MGSVRMNVTLPEDVAETLKELGGKRGQSAFISESIRHYSEKIRKEHMHKELRAQYQEASKEDSDLLKDFDPTLADGLEDT
jgi:metal-responsive CopG/Arc/MetJ family transcriptional regulator